MVDATGAMRTLSVRLVTDFRDVDLWRMAHGRVGVNFGRFAMRIAAVVAHVSMDPDID